MHMLRANESVLAVSEVLSSRDLSAPNEDYYDLRCLRLKSKERDEEIDKLASFVVTR